MVIDGFDHTPGAHCGSTSLRDLSDYYGWGFDEPACFGLGAGLGFSYSERTESPRRSFVGRSPWLETAFFEYLDIDHEVRAADWGTAWPSITAHLDDGDPVMLFVDLYYLDYYDTDTHFGPHSLLAVGHGDDTVTLADSEFADLQELPLERVEAAMTSGHLPVKNRYLVVTDPTIRASTADAVEEAIPGAFRAMIDPDDAPREPGGSSTYGIEAEYAFAAGLPEWADLPDASWCARFAYQTIERRGTGGGAFRQLYADFLETADEFVSLPPSAPERMGGIADAWTALSEALRDASEAEGDAEMRRHLERAAAEATGIAVREEALIEETLDGL